MASSGWLLSAIRIVAVGASLAASAALRAAPGDQTPESALCPSADLARVADSVAAAFDTHQFVFLGSTHGGSKSHEFLLCLLSRPDFQRRATDVLVEWANPVHQGLVDRYLLALEPVPGEALRPVWFDTDAPELWARLPLIPEFYAAVRAINTTLGPSRRIRVLGGCEPIEWAAVGSAADIASYPFKTNWAAHVIVEHFAPRPEKRLLVVYGDGHIHHHGGTLMSDVEAKLERARLFVVGTIGSPGADEEESLARLGDPARPFFVSGPRLPSSGPYPRDLFYARDGALATYVEAVAYLGPAPDRDLSGTRELTAEENAELARRNALRGDRRRLMELRFEQRDRWFRSHPDDLLARP